MLKGTLCVFAIAAVVASKQGLADDKPMGTPYSISLENLECVNTSDCGVSIPAVPANKILVVQHITGFAVTSQDVPFLRGHMAASPTTGTSGNTIHPFVMNRVATWGLPSVSYNVNIPMLAFVMPGAPNPGISIVAGGSGSSTIIQMTISGYLIDSAK
jgi:hypothetical protein